MTRPRARDRRDVVAWMKAADLVVYYEGNPHRCGAACTRCRNRFFSWVVLFGGERHEHVDRYPAP